MARFYFGKLTRYQFNHCPEALKPYPSSGPSSIKPAPLPLSSSGDQHAPSPPPPLCPRPPLPDHGQAEARTEAQGQAEPQGQSQAPVGAWSLLPGHLQRILGVAVSLRL